MKREDVEALMHEARESGGSVGHVDATYLYALCRRWLAVEDAPGGRLDIGRNDPDESDMVEIVMDPAHVSHLQYRRVRIVPEQGEG